MSLPKQKIVDEPELKENESTKNEWAFEYFVGAFVSALIYSYCVYPVSIFSSSIFSFLNFIAYTLGGLIIPAILSGVIIFFSKGRFAKTFFWTSISLFGLMYLNLLLEYY